MILKLVLSRDGRFGVAYYTCGRSLVIMFTGPSVLSVEMKWFVENKQ